MRLLKEVKSSARNPLSIKSFYVMFITLFTLILIPLIVLNILNQRSFLAEARNTCAVPANRSFSGKADKTKDGEHIFTFKGKNCSLSAWVNGKDSKNISLWLYEPDGSIQVVDDNKNKSYEFLYLPEPVQEGKYRLAVRVVSGESSRYSAHVTFR